MKKETTPKQEVKTEPKAKKVVEKKPAVKSLNIYEKVYAVQQEVAQVMKTGRNEYHKYNYAKEGDIVGELKPLLGKYRILVLTADKARETITGITYTTHEISLVNVDKPEERIVADAFGEGKDEGDKKTPKAKTMALKYYLAKMFLIITDDEGEDQPKAPETPTVAPGKKTPTATTPAPKKAHTPTTEESEAKYKQAVAWVEKSNNVDGLIDYSEQLTIRLQEKTTTLTEAQVKDIQGRVNKRVAELTQG